MEVIIIEDEFPAAERLEKQLKNVDHDIAVLAVLDSVKSAINWMKSNEHPCLVFCDIQLSDGLSFEIFEYIETESAIIFTTSYDEYAIQAFKMNSIDYLLKPIKQPELKISVEKFLKYQHKTESASATDLKAFVGDMLRIKSGYKNRFLVKTGGKYVPVETSNIAYFYTSNELVYLKDFSNQKFVVEYNLEQLNQKLDPDLFYRANRQTLVNIHSVKQIHNHFNSKLKLGLEPKHAEEVLVSKDKARSFKDWMENED